MSEETSSKARFLIEQGDMGIEPGKRYPVVRGDDIHSQIWRATNGATEADHNRHLLWPQIKAQKENPHLYIIKRVAKRKVGRLALPVFGITDASIDDILPRNLTADQFTNLYAAVSFANSDGVILRAHVTIAWSLLGYKDHDEIAEVLSKRFIKHYAQWCRDNDATPMWIYTHECSPQVGLHTHFLCAVPDELLVAFRAWIKGRVGTITLTNPPSKRAVRVVAPPSDPLGRQWRMFQYICKSVAPYAIIKSPDHAETEEGSVFVADLIQFGYENPGEIKCKNREGTSANIGASARKDVGFTSLLEQGVLDVRRLYGGEVYRQWQEWCAREELLAWMDSGVGL